MKTIRLKKSSGKLTLLLFALIVVVSIGCNNKLEHTLSTDKHLNYYQHTNLGLLAIVDGEFDKSVENYKIAFKNDIGFPVDYYNALAVSNKVGDLELSSYSALKLADLGLCEEFFEGFDILKSNQELYRKLKNRILESEKLRDIELGNKVYDIYEVDQKIRDYYDEKLPKDERIKKNKIRNKTDSLNFLKFDTIVKEYGFPTTMKIGLECSESKRGYNPPYYNILMIHFAELKHQRIIDLLNNSYKNFEISNMEYAVYIDQAKGGAYYRIKPSIVKIGEKFYYWKMNKEQLEEVNRHRGEIGLPDYYQEVKIMKDKIHNKNNVFYRYDGRIVALPKEIHTKEKIEKNFVPLDSLKA